MNSVVQKTNMVGFINLGDIQHKSGIYSNETEWGYQWNKCRRN